ncbi:hypothetical protein [Nostoc sp. FACHB-280]|uniref:hypothetical protein n=1 Tax=Nostoc sp. FACHB-280 TaxID=2692839 RepID=UPI00168A446D|nr:hypothetical protein [Nostoc sp. FACHB-280]MBD2494997.1 hypothetical protein [Nostoc sp. FACHB-280]
MPRQFWFMAPKEGTKYASVGCSDWSDAYSKLEFAELAFCQDDDFYHVYAYATKFTEIQDFNDKKWKFEPYHIKFKVAKRDYQKEDKDKNKVEVKQSRLEKWICHLFTGLVEGAVYSGFINLQDDLYCDLFVTGKDIDGKDIDPMVLTQMQKMSVGLTLVESPTHILAEDLKVPQGKGAYFGEAVVFAVDAATMYQAGYIFYCSDNGVWLVDAVPPEYLRQL